MNKHLWLIKGTLLAHSLNTLLRQNPLRTNPLRNTMEKSWVFPKKTYIKINTHAVYSSHSLPNGNQSGLGIVLRDQKGTIILMISGTIPDVTERANELWAFLIGLRCAFYEEEYNIQIETYNEEAAKEWQDWRWFVEPNHAGVIQQLLQRSSDPNLKLDKVKVIATSQNRLATFLAEDGAHNRNRLVMFRRPFGLVRQIWRLDMGLGLVDERFMVVSEEVYEEEQVEEVEMGAEHLVHDVLAPNMGIMHPPPSPIMSQPPSPVPAMSPAEE